MSRFSIFSNKCTSKGKEEDSNNWKRNNNSAIKIDTMTTNDSATSRCIELKVSYSKDNNKLIVQSQRK